MRIRQDPSSLVQSSAIGISGWIYGQPIEALPVAALSFSGGRSVQNSRDVTLNNLVGCKFAEASTHIEYTARGRSTNLSSVVVLEGVQIAGVISADRIVARLTGSGNDWGLPTISLLGTHFHNLRIAGHPVRVELALDGRFLEIEGKPVSGSLVRKTETHLVGVNKSEHILSIPNFGTIAFAEYHAGEGTLGLTMLRIEVEDFRPITEFAMGSISVNVVPNRTVERPQQENVFADAERNRIHEPTPEAWQLARSLTHKLINGERSGALRYTEEERQIYLTDVRSDVAKFRQAKHALSKYHLPFPCLLARGLPGPIPIFLGLENSVFEVAGERNLPEQFVSMACREVLEHLSRARRLTLDPDARVEHLDVDVAEKQFCEGLDRFLAVRFDARHSNISADPGHLFTVRTDSPHLTIHISPAYAIDPNLSFGDQLSPEATQYVQPGRWIFGAPELDTTNMVDIPPRKATHIQK